MELDAAAADKPAVCTTLPHSRQNNLRIYSRRQFRTDSVALRGNVKNSDADAADDPFVKIQLVHGLKLAKTKKTSFIKGTIDPFYNESFSFRVQQEELGNASLVFTGQASACLLPSTEEPSRIPLTSSVDRS
uniref:Uncharacterized protein n=1 Tax=Sphaerodactylus townsendi TaxID=933632 RepID=A0ACB8FLB1_9SAUR